MMICGRLLSYAFFLKTVVASPIDTIKTPSGSTCLAILLVISWFLSFLVIWKWIFLRKRRATVVQTSSLNSSSTLPPSAIGIVSVDEKSGFIVGFLGSPAWETRIHKLTRKGYQTSPVIFQLQNDCLWNKSGTTHNASATEDGSLVEGPNTPLLRSAFGALHQIHDATGQMTQRKSRSLRLPARPSRAQISSPAGPVFRRFSLPSMSRRISDVSTLPFPGNSSLRLVESRLAAPDCPLPLAARQTQLEVAVAPSQKMSSWPQSAHNGTGTSPHPAFVPRLMTPVLQISHPYPLSAVSSNITTLSSHSSSSNRGLSSSKNQMQNGRNSFAPVISPIDHSSIIVSHSPAHTFPTTKAPLAPRRPARVTQKDKYSYARPRRSPTLGPSPLRTMILPDVSDSSLSINVKPWSDTTRLKNSFRQPLDLGLGFSFPLEKIDTQNQTSQLRQDCFIVSNRHSGTVDAEEPNVLLGIIRELVEETKEWDNSLFVNQDFKSMIENSKVLALNNPFLPSAVCVDPTQHESDEPEGESDISTHNFSFDVLRPDGAEHLRALNSSDIASKQTAVQSYWEDEASEKHIGIAC